MYNDSILTTREIIKSDCLPGLLPIIRFLLLICQFDAPVRPKAKQRSKTGGKTLAHASLDHFTRLNGTELSWTVPILHQIYIDKEIS